MIILKCLLVLVIMTSIWFLLIRSISRDYDKLQKKKDLTLEYLKTVKVRANLSTMPEALYMLHVELIDSCDKYVYHKDTFEEYKRIAAYITGKYHGLKKISN